ncbi:MAG TPA: hypothetical protein VIX20_04685 [Ktedonobacteraceae bacterium]
MNAKLIGALLLLSALWGIIFIRTHCRTGTRSSAIDRIARADSRSGLFIVYAYEQKYLRPEGM